MAGNRSSQGVVGVLQGMSGVRKATLTGAAALLIVIIWWLGKWASEPTYVALFSQLEYSEMAPIQEKLDKAGIRHKLGVSGNEILVPLTEAARARVALAKDGLPGRGRPGLELFDKPSWGMTDFTQRVTFQRALEGELSRTIETIRGIAKAQVHLVLPTPSPLRHMEKPASASVVLSLAQGSALSAESVRGITYIVSNSVEGLAAENVAVMDDRGSVLSIPSANGSGAGLASWQIETQRSVEQDLSLKIEDLLGTVLGAGRVKAQVSAEMSFDQVDRTVETYDPDGQVLQSEQRSESEAGGSTAGASPAVMINNAYQNSRRLERRVGSVGTVNRLTAAVLVDQGAMATAGGAGGGTGQIARLEAMVRDAIGADSTRGDRVSVLAVTFGSTALPDAAAKPERPPLDLMMMAERVGRPLAGLVAILALVFLGLRFARSMPAGMGAARFPDGRTEAIGPTPALPAPVPAEIATLTGGALSDSIGRPEVTARVMRNWLGDKG